MGKRKIYLVELKAIQRKYVAIEADDENEAGNIADDLLVWGDVDFKFNSTYKEDFTVLKELSEEETQKCKTIN